MRERERERERDKERERYIEYLQTSWFTQQAVFGKEEKKAGCGATDGYEHSFLPEIGSLLLQTNRIPVSHQLFLQSTN